MRYVLATSEICGGDGPFRCWLLPHLTFHEATAKVCRAREKRGGAAQLGETTKQTLEEQSEGVRAEKPVFKINKSLKRLACAVESKSALLPPCSPLYPWLSGAVILGSS